MEVSAMIAGLDAEIKKLTEARRILETLGGSPATSATAPDKPRRGRPKGSKNASTLAASASTTKAKRKLSPEGRKRIADAMKRRWAERKKEPAAK